MQALLLALALGQVATPEAPAPAAPPVATPRDVTVVRRPDGGFDAALDGRPVAGSDFYRAVLRFDLAGQYDAAHDRKQALAVAAVAAPLAGLTAGWVYSAVHSWPTPYCASVVPQPPNCQQMIQQNKAWNQQHLRRGLLVGGLSGLAIGLGLGWASGRIDLPAPTADEAEALARAYRARNGLVRPAPAGSLRLTPVPGGALLSIAGRL